MLLRFIGEGQVYEWTKLIDSNLNNFGNEKNVESNAVWYLVFLRWITHYFFSPLLLPTGNQFPPIAAQDLPFVLKAGYLEKRRKGKL